MSNAWLYNRNRIMRQRSDEQLQLQMLLLLNEDASTIISLGDDINADGFYYPNFSISTGTVLVGSGASITSNIVRLTTATTNSIGNVYRNTKIRYNRNFSLNWSSSIGSGTGADGYCIQWTTTNNSNGIVGGGVSRISASSTIHALGFFTFTANDVKWYKNNTLQSTDPANITGNWRQTLYFWADYNHINQTLDLYYSTTNTKPGSPKKTYTGFAFDSTEYYMGFGAATGASYDEHKILSWNLTFN
jgi:hypothetical protein